MFKRALVEAPSNVILGPIPPLLLPALQAPPLTNSDISATAEAPEISAFLLSLKDIPKGFVTNLVSARRQVSFLYQKMKKILHFIG